MHLHFTHGSPYIRDLERLYSQTDIKHDSAPPRYNRKRHKREQHQTKEATVKNSVHPDRATVITMSNYSHDIDEYQKTQNNHPTHTTHGRHGRHDQQHKRQKVQGSEEATHKHSLF